MYFCKICSLHGIHCVVIRSSPVWCQGCCCWSINKALGVVHVEDEKFTLTICSPSANEASLGYRRACLEESTNKPLLFMDLEFAVVCHIFDTTYMCVWYTHTLCLHFVWKLQLFLVFGYLQSLLTLKGYKEAVYHYVGMQVFSDSKYFTLKVMYNVCIYRINLHRNFVKSGNITVQCCDCALVSKKLGKVIVGTESLSVRNHRLFMILGSSKLSWESKSKLKN